MKLSVTVLILNAAAMPMLATADVDNTSACATVLCLAGLMAGGNGGAQCSGYENEYFSIVRYHRGHFDLSGTSSARGEYLNQCRSVGSAQRDAVNSKYGGIEHGP